ncbi:MAG: hypothetical protein AAFY71_12000 [Bacteroidota bacterium]
MSVVIAFHPLNSLKWNADSWRDSLENFAEANQVILICPNGGTDGKTDSEAELDFAKKLTREMLVKYGIQPNCIYALGFSWGSRSALKMAVRHRNFINGLILMGVNYHNLPLSRKDFGKCFNLPCYLIQGQRDQLPYKFYPLQKILNQSGACVQSVIIPHTGHSFTFPYRNEYLTQAFQWLFNASCNKPEFVWKENKMLERKKQEKQPVVNVRGLNVSIQNVHALQLVKKISVYNQRGILIRVVRNPEGVAIIKVPQQGDYLIALQSSYQTDHLKVKVDKP